MDIIQCGICLDNYTEIGERAPYNLSCGHTFCYRCLQSLFQQSRKACPIDRRLIQERLQDLPRNLALIALIPTLKALSLTAQAKFCLSDSVKAVASETEETDTSSLSTEKMERIIATRKREYLERQKIEVRIEIQSQTDLVTAHMHRKDEIEHFISQYKLMINQLMDEKKGEEDMISACNCRVQTLKKNLRNLGRGCDLTESLEAGLSTLRIPDGPPWVCGQRGCNMICKSQVKLDRHKLEGHY